MIKKTIVIYALIAGLFTGCAMAKEEPKEAQNQVNTYELLNLFGEIMERTKSSYVEEVSDKQLIESAINGMLTSLDPHSSYLTEEDFRYMNEQTKGKFGGLGIQVTMENGVVKVISPIDDTPAHKAGIKAGDYITDIDGKTVIGMTLNEAVSKLRGKIGTSVKITIRRVNEKPFTVTLKREEIKMDSVKSEIKNKDILYVRISSFNEDVDKDTEKAINDAQKKLNNKLAGIVLDVRNNPGGLLEQAIGVSDLFLDHGEIVSTRSRNDEDTIKYTATAGDVAQGLPMVVLINEGSASASEIVAGALQDHHRAVIVGEKSFGKGSVQTVLQLRNNAAMRITTARYYTPSGRSIQAKGIEPDVVVKPAKIEEIKSYGLNLSEADLKGALKNEQDKDKDKKDENNKKEELTDKNDYQLIRALDLVKALYLYNQNDALSQPKTEDKSEAEKPAEESKK